MMKRRATNSSSSSRGVSQVLLSDGTSNYFLSLAGDNCFFFAGGATVVQSTGNNNNRQWFLFVCVLRHRTYIFLDVLFLPRRAFERFRKRQQASKVAGTLATTLFLACKEGRCNSNNDDDVVGGTGDDVRYV